MSLSREEIVDQLKEIVGSERVITDETVLKKTVLPVFVNMLIFTAFTRCPSRRRWLNSDRQNKFPAF